MYKPYRLVQFPSESYPVLYKAFLLQGDGGQESQYELANVFELQDSTDALNAISQVYLTYYDLTFNVDTLYQVPFAFIPTPYSVVFTVVYVVNGIEYYVWEYLPVWNNIKRLHLNYKL